MPEFRCWWWHARWRFGLVDGSGLAFRTSRRAFGSIIASNPQRRVGLRALGIDGDLYLDTAADAYYGPKAAGIWGEPTGLVGPQGEEGIQGVKGDVGEQGPAGTVSTKLIEGNWDSSWEGFEDEATSTATCEVDEVLLSGGYRLLPAPGYGESIIIISSNRPNGANGWTVTATDYGGMGFDLQAWALCIANPT